MKQISKRNFLKYLSGFFLLPFIYLFDKLIDIEINSKNRRHSFVEIPNNFIRQITFFENFIVIKQNNTLQIFSSKCTHLGCKINKIDNHKLICPCHGSVYSINGKVLNGPAIKNLTQLSFKTDLINNKIKVLIDEAI